MHTIPYNDKYSIIYMYTEAFGRASYLVSRSRGKKSTVSKALFIPLSVLPFQALVKTRYRQTEQPAAVFPQGDRVRLEFREPQRAVTPGQGAVVYDEEGTVLGGGTIAEVLPR